MNALLLTVLTWLAPVVGSAVQTSVAGEWQIHRIAAGRESTQTCTFKQKDSDLTGTCSSDSGPVPLTGKVEGKTVTWTYKADSEGGKVTVVYNGTLESETKMSGTVSAVEFSVEGEFTATRSK